MPKFTASQESKAVHSLLPQALAASANKGAAVDCKGFDEALIVLLAGATSSNGSHAAKVQESNTTTDGDFEDIAGAAFTAVTTGEDEAVYVGRLNLRPRKRYIRVVDTGSNQTMLGAALVILSQAKECPVSQVNDVAFSI